MIKFIVDSTFCVSKEYAQKHDIKIVELALILDGVVTNEGFPDEWDDFYKRFESSDSFPTTSQANPQMYDDAIKSILEVDPTAEIMLLTIAGSLSGTINSAKESVKGFKNNKIAVIDSNNVSICSLMLLEEMVSAAENGESFENILSMCEQIKTKLSVQFIPDTMVYLQKGGRVGKLSAILASIMSVKPIFDFRNNIVSVPAKALGLSRGVVAMIKRLPEKIKSLYICYIHDNKNVPMIVEKVKKALNLESIKTFAVNPVFGVHIGIGAIGLACLEK